MSEDRAEYGDETERRVCLDLFSGLGGREDVEHGFSSAFQVSSGWDVVTVDFDAEFEPDLCADVLGLRPADLRDLLGDYDVLVILAGHPCTLFSTAGNHDEWDLEAHEPVGERARRHVTMLYHTLGLIKALAPDYWYLENPKRSRINWLIGPPDATVTYCQYGMDYQKPTGLWGDHAPGMTYKSCPRGGNCHASNTEDDGTSAVQSMPSDTGERSLFPRELSEAILDAVETAIETPPPTQSELPLVTDGGADQHTDGTEQASLVEASRPSGVVIDEDGDLCEHGGFGGVYVDGEYSLDETVDVLAERFDAVTDDLPESVDEWERHGHHYREQTSAAWRWDRPDEEVWTLYLFPRGPHLRDWTLLRHRDFENGGDSSGWVMEGSGYDTPADALDDAIAFMEGCDNA